ncbi:hypothetical protein Y1Q_0007468 [Alligator mississippiensis]|uniref:Uncharacterized protein n=1 Tax=Alligator mississippiensis TaxID=8496 RepID=A0A151M4S7_ALLMI|nr:hypothetical protein Y1Q_0007468 [Alligator mississippiensis]
MEMKVLFLLHYLNYHGEDYKQRVLNSEEKNKKQATGELNTDSSSLYTKSESSKKHSLHLRTRLPFSPLAMERATDTKPHFEQCI